MEAIVSAIFAALAILTKLDELRQKKERGEELTDAEMQFARDSEVAAQDRLRKLVE